MLLYFSLQVTETGVSPS